MTAGGVADAYPSPIPEPTSSPKPITIGKILNSEAKLEMISPAPAQTPPSVATIRGPTLSCALPASTITIANTPQATA